MGGTRLLNSRSSDKEAAVVDAVRLLTTSADLVRVASIPVETVSCGGTGTYTITARQPGVARFKPAAGFSGTRDIATRSQSSRH